MNKNRFADMTYYILRQDGAYSAFHCGGLLERAIRTDRDS